MSQHDSILIIDFGSQVTQLIAETGVYCAIHTILRALGNSNADSYLMKNIQVIDGAENSVYDIFGATEAEFSLIFPSGTDIAFIDEVMTRGPKRELDAAFAQIWRRRIPKKDAMGIHGLLFYELEHKKIFYPTRRDEEAVNPDGSRLR